MIQILENIEPSVPFGENKDKFILNFNIMKICFKIAKLGKGIWYVYDWLDKNKSNSIDAVELLKGLWEDFNVFIKESQITKLV